MTRHLLPAAILVLALAIAYAATPTAAAQQPSRGAVCAVSTGTGKRAISELQEWMNTQLATGRSDFVVPPFGNSGRVICAW
ncbi:MAG: hypothetical protein KTR31_04965 [Myxococcales bacterium]|nr:hypothetical protein [Myxococcales bacterium]